MKILHTSDWHLGRSLYGRKRYEEFSAFLDWLLQTIDEGKIDVLLIAGDVFDTSAPSNRAQELYYRFLGRVSVSHCRHVVVIAGNHDSPSFLNAPKDILRTLNVHVIGAMTQAVDDELILLQNGDKPEAIVCAVPYLRDNDIRTVEPGESIGAKNTKLVDGLKGHYADVCRLAEQKRSELANAGHNDIPVIAMGHLFMTGGITVDGDGVRDLCVGSLIQTGNADFPSMIDYFALGHLHIPQMIGNAPHIRYSGSPIPMGYGEATREKKVVVVEFAALTPNIREISIPTFQQLLRIDGSVEEIHAQLDALKAEKSTAWLEIEYTGNDSIGNLRELLDEALADTAMEIRRIKNRQVMNRVIAQAAEGECLDDLDELEVFTRCLDAAKVADESRDELIASYNEILRSIHEEDVNA